MRNPFFRMSLGFLTVSLVLFVGDPWVWGQTQLEKIRVAYSAISPTQLHGWVPLEAGFYRRNGLDVDMVLFTASPVAVAALVAGETPIIQAAAVGVIYSNLSGSGAVMITGAINRFPYQLFVSPEIGTFQELKGKKLGVSRIGGGDYSSATIVLKKQGLNPEKEITFIQVGSVPARLSALLGKSVQATLLISPETLKAREGGLRMLLDFTQLDVEYQHTGIATTRDFVRKRPETVRRFVKAYVEGIHYILTNPKGTKEIMRKFLQVKDEKAIDETYNELVLKVTRRVPYPTEKGIQLILDQLKTANPKAAKANPADFIEASFLKELEESGYMDRLYR